MKSICIVFSFVICSHFVCNDGYPDRGKIVCDKVSCYDYFFSNNLKMEVTDLTYHYFHKRNTIGIFCSVTNMTKDTLLLNRDDFSIFSRTQSYQSTPFGVVENFKVINYPDVIKIDPNSHISYIFSFKSQKKMSYKYYQNLIATDTIIFSYNSHSKREKIFSMILEK